MEPESVINKTFEILAPGGDIDSIKAAVAAGADAVYFGLNKFNARNRATNVSLNELNGIIRLAHGHNCKVFLTLNVLILQSEIPYLFSILNTVANTNIDGIIVQDLGVFYILSHYFKSLRAHASTQLNTHNKGQIRFIAALNATRVNLARELSIDEIKDLTKVCRQNGMKTEVFVHGSYCISFSGLCYISSVLGGRSGNRGMCSQHCRENYVVTPSGKHYPLNLKDNSAFYDIGDLLDAGVDSLKIEGRIKPCDYVYTVVRSWRKRLESLEKNDDIPDNHALYTVFNRDFSNGYLRGRIDKTMFIDDPHDHSFTHLRALRPGVTHEELLSEKDAIIKNVKTTISTLSIDQEPVTIRVSGKEGEPVTVSVQTLGRAFNVQSETNLISSPPAKTLLCLNHDEILKRLDFLNRTEFFIRELNTEYLDPGLALSFSAFTAVRNRIFSCLNRSKERINPVEVPKFRQSKPPHKKPGLFVLISSPGDLNLCRTGSADICYQVPNALKYNLSESMDIFQGNPALIPWFPPVLIGENYDAAVGLIRNIRPEQIVTNNTGIAVEARKQGISWIAGPFLNTVNSYSLLCLRETFGCDGAFLSNELGKKQLRGIKAPPDFSLYYSIFHPIFLLSSRQCLIHQIKGCDKSCFNDECLANCHRSATIQTLNGETLQIEKTKGNHAFIHHQNHYLNTCILKDFPHMFSKFLIDLRHIRTETRMPESRQKTITLFEKLIHGTPDSDTILENTIFPTTNTQYLKGI